MFLTSKDIINFDESALKAFLDKKIMEGHHIDYKIDLSGGNHTKQRTEFLKDVNAFANASGGHLIIGVKEPEDNLSVEDQIVGIENGKKISEDLERVVRDCIEPGITGLQIIPVPLSNKKFVILVHIPPSFNKPHMVYYDKHQYLYIRHRESSNLMTMNDIRETIFASASTEAKVKGYLEEKENEFRKYDQRKDVPVFVLQAIPLIPPRTTMGPPESPS